jgi:hypothetical protein
MASLPDVDRPATAPAATARTESEVRFMVLIGRLSVGSQWVELTGLTSERRRVGCRRCLRMRRPCGSEKAMDGFGRITGFREEPYERTRSRLSVVDGRLCWARLAGPRGGLRGDVLAATLNRQSVGNRTVYLTQRGGGAFGNDADGIHAAMRPALERCRDSALDVRLVSYSGVPGQLGSWAQAFSE